MYIEHSTSRSESNRGTIPSEKRAVILGSDAVKHLHQTSNARFHIVFSIELCQACEEEARLDTNDRGLSAFLFPFPGQSHRSLV